MSQDERNEVPKWVGTDRNRDRAAKGRDAIQWGQGDFDVDDEAEKHAKDGDSDLQTAAIDTMTNLFHFLASCDMDQDDIADAIRIASDHFETEQDGTDE